MSTHYFTIKPLQYDVFVGMDVDKTSISVTVVSHEGELLQRKLPYDAANLLALIAKRFPTKKIAFCYEAGPTGYGLYDQIASAGFKRPYGLKKGLQQSLAEYGRYKAESRGRDDEAGS